MTQDSSGSVGFTETERAFLAALNAAGVKFMVVGLSAARLQGATVVTEDIDLWFEPGSETAIAAAARDTGVVYVPSGVAMNPPQFGGRYVRLDQVLTLSGLGSFEAEEPNSISMEVSGIPIRVLKLDRILHSKRVADRAKDRAVLPALEAAVLAAHEMLEE